MFSFGQIVYFASWLVFPAIVLFVIQLRAKKLLNKILAVVLLILSLLFCYARFVEPRLLQINSHELNLRYPNPYKIKIALLGDFHLGFYRNTVSLEKIVKKVNEQEPDIIFLVGDFVEYMKPEKVSQELSALADLQALKFAVLGNHDLGDPGRDFTQEITQALKSAGVDLIDQKTRNLQIKNTNLFLIGLGELWNSRTDFELFNNLEASSLVIALCHNPDTVYKIPSGSLVDLALAGHTHGGQIRLPWLYQKMIPTEHNFDKGLYDINGLPLFITTGTGLTGLPLRFLAPPEIVILEI